MLFVSKGNSQNRTLQTKTITTEPLRAERDVKKGAGYSVEAELSEAEWCRDLAEQHRGTEL